MTKQELRIEVLIYEITSSWWSSWMFFDWAQELTARYFAWKVKRKFDLYQKAVERHSK